MHACLGGGVLSVFAGAWDPGGFSRHNVSVTPGSCASLHKCCMSKPAQQGSPEALQSPVNCNHYYYDHEAVTVYEFVKKKKLVHVFRHVVHLFFQHFSFFLRFFSSFFFLGNFFIPYICIVLLLPLFPSSLSVSAPPLHLLSR